MMPALVTRTFSMFVHGRNFVLIGAPLVIPRPSTTSNGLPENSI
jgi:hypothetical protein